MKANYMKSQKRKRKKMLYFSLEIIVDIPCALFQLVVLTLAVMGIASGG
jgi:hypothetical protein